MPKPAGIRDGETRSTAILWRFPGGQAILRSKGRRRQMCRGRYEVTYSIIFLLPAGRDLTWDAVGWYALAAPRVDWMRRLAVLVCGGLVGGSA
jgi:hypothetical protein